jgi:hypothetical protein
VSPNHKPSQRGVRASLTPDGTKPAVDLAIPAFGYKNHVSPARRFGLIRTWTATDAAA